MVHSTQAETTTPETPYAVSVTTPPRLAMGASAPHAGATFPAPIETTTSIAEAGADNVTTADDAVITQSQPAVAAAAATAATAAAAAATSPTATAGPATGAAATATPAASTNTAAAMTGNTNPEPQFAMSEDGTTRREWASWRKEETYAPEVTPKRAAYLYALVTYIQKELEKLGIRAYAEGGSMLGQARDGGIIRYDDDIDMQIHWEDKQRFLDAAETLTQRVRAWGEAIGEAADLVWTGFGYMALLIPTKDASMQVLRRPGSLKYYVPIEAEVDLFLMDRVVDADGVARVVYSDEVFRRRMQARGDGDIAADRLGDLPAVPFGPTTIRMPADGRGACKDVFGPACFDRVVCKDGRKSDHNGGSVAVPMDAESLAFYHWLLERTMGDDAAAGSVERH